ncbi:MAG: DUF1704 domain-containing protein, partial [Chloroflexi bacterium]|nr:DUF1704 domain-containing protein [Chloroflexota bacterium]
MFAENALEEIEQWRRQTTSSQYQLDWRWIERYRELDAFDAYWWWAQAGPFTEEEQQQWDQLFTQNRNEAAKEQLGAILAQSRERELANALAEQRQPRLHYPTIDIEQVRSRIAALHQLDAEMSQKEPNAIVRRLYHETIEEEVYFLRMIEATYEGNNEQFWQFSRCVYPEPTREEMSYALSRVWQVIQQGLQDAETAELSRRLIQFMHERLQLSQDLSSDRAETQETSLDSSTSSSKVQKMVTVQAAKRFLETVIQQSGYGGWQVVVDKASTTRVEAGLRRLILADSPMSVEQIRYYLIHELGSHVVRAIAGERSPLGLLGIGTKNYAPTEEGLAIYHERQIATLHGHALNRVSQWSDYTSTNLSFAVHLSRAIVPAT